jgi:hypothetical protein
MPTAESQAKIAALLDAERAQGVSEGIARARQEFFGQNAAFLLAHIFADAMESAAGYIGPHDQRFAGALTQQAALMRAFVDPPKVVSHSPSQDAANVASDAAVTALFDMDVRRASVTESMLVRSSAGGPALAASVEYDERRRIATLTTANGFTSGVAYTVTIDGVKSAAGTPMAEPKTWSFTAA